MDRRIGHKTGLMTGSFERIEVITGVAGRRRWSVEEKLRMVAESLMPDMPVSAVARRHGVRSNLLFKWRRLAREGAFGPLRERAFVRADPADAGSFVTAGGAAGVVGCQAADCMVEIALPNGCRLRVSAEIDGRALRRLVTALKAAG
jgi:transposase